MPLIPAALQGPYAKQVIEEPRIKGINGPENLYPVRSLSEGSFNQLHSAGVITEDHQWLAWSNQRRFVVGPPCNVFL